MSQETTHEALPEEPSLAGVRNFRDVGGLPTFDGRRVRSRRLYRSGHLAHATAEDTVFLSGLGLRTIFDFRNSEDIAMEGPDVALPGVRQVAMPLSDPAYGAEFWRIVREGDIDQLRTELGNGRASQQMVGSYRQLIVERTGEHAALLRELSEGEGLPALVHCAAGKDRAGLSVMVILLALGVVPEAIEADYLASNALHRRYRVRISGDRSPAHSAEALALRAPLFEAKVEYLQAALGTIATTWGDTDRYLTEALNCGSDRRERLRELLVDGKEATMS